VVVVVVVVLVLATAGSFMARGAFGGAPTLGTLGGCEVKAQVGTGILLGTSTQFEADRLLDCGGCRASGTDYLVLVDWLVGVGEGFPCLGGCLSAACPDPGEKALHVPFLAGSCAIVVLYSALWLGGSSP
jgi:hypothetical protein